ncbi:hypothetical protein JW977_00855 [Candidatus Falkowbacteria bacterium]|nr:hypothetical protein [Candidatus Falkowbacteria bacterium]
MFCAVLNKIKKRSDCADNEIYRPRYRRREHAIPKRIYLGTFVAGGKEKNNFSEKTAQPHQGGRGAQTPKKEENNKERWTAHGETRHEEHFFVDPHRHVPGLTPGTSRAKARQCLTRK